MVSFLIFSFYLSPVREARERGELRHFCTRYSENRLCIAPKNGDTRIRVSNSNGRERGVAGLSLTLYNEVIMGNVATTNFVFRVGDILHEK